MRQEITQIPVGSCLVLTVAIIKYIMSQSSEMKALVERINSAWLFFHFFIINNYIS